MDSLIFFSLVIYIFGTFISSVSQIILKKSTQKEYTINNKLITFLNGKLKFLKLDVREYLNVRVIGAYFIFFVATLCTVFAYKYVPLSMGPILGATEYIFVAVLSWLFLKEKITKQKLLGLSVIISGIIIYSL